MARKRNDRPDFSVDTRNESRFGCSFYPESRAGAGLAAFDYKKLCVVHMRMWCGFLLSTSRRYHVTARTTLASEIYRLKKLGVGCSLIAFSEHRRSKRIKNWHSPTFP